jgi:DNA-directed RNA polymerase alpha subunit
VGFKDAVQALQDARKVINGIYPSAGIGQVIRVEEKLKEEIDKMEHCSHYEAALEREKTETITKLTTAQAELLADFESIDEKGFTDQNTAFLKACQPKKYDGTTFYVSALSYFRF